MIERLSEALGWPSCSDVAFVAHHGAVTWRTSLTTSDPVAPLHPTPTAPHCPARSRPAQASAAQRKLVPCNVTHQEMLLQAGPAASGPRGFGSLGPLAGLARLILPCPSLPGGCGLTPIPGSYEKELASSNEGSSV